MGRQSGGVRPVSKKTTAFENRRAEFGRLMSSGEYSSGYFSTKAGGFFVVEKSKYPHKPEELEAATHLADGGYKVTLVSETGYIKTKEGYVFSYSYEQSTPDMAQGGHGVKKCLGHAKSKDVEVAVIYDKYNRFHREDIYAGIEEFDKYNRTYRFKHILVIDSNGKIHPHKHGEKP